MEPVVYLTPSCGLQGKLIPRPTSTAEEEGRDVYNFLGVPYAEPPVGKLRFCDPKPISLWSGLRSATEVGAVCPQDFGLLHFCPVPLEKPSLISEDCLYLNIWTPSLNNVSHLPVMVWIHAGVLSEIYDAKALACFHNVVVVTVTHRLSSFGYLCVNDDSAPGNYGILDQIEALRWIQNHIVNFGGDPENVTLCGQSGGGVSVSLLVVSPLAKGLFKRVITQSGTVFSADLGCKTAKDAFASMYAFMADSLPGCPPPTATGSEIVEFLRNQSADVLVSTFERFQFTPVVDGRVFPVSARKLYETGDFNYCELLAGCNSDEGEILYEMFAAMSNVKLDADAARNLLTEGVTSLWTVKNGEQVYKSLVDTYVKEDVVYTTEDLRKAIAECIGDVLFTFPSIKAASCHSRRCKTYFYQFCHRPPFSKCPDYARADHGSELLYVLRHLGLGIEFTEEDVEMSRQMAKYWTNFAKTGNPNGFGLEEWPEYNETTRRHLVLELPPKPSSNLKEDRAEFWLHQLPKLLERGSL